MVLESIFPTDSLLKNKFLLFIYTAIICLFSIGLSLIFFKQNTSILSIAFTTIAFMYFLNKVYFTREKIVLSKEKKFFAKYGFLIKIYLKIFITVSVIFTLLFVFLPVSYKEIIFTEQLNTLNTVDNIKDTINISGNLYLSNPQGLFGYIFLNNLGVILAILLFSFLFGVGALFIIIYQASVFGTIVGAEIISLIPIYANFSSGKLIAFLHGSFLGLGLLPHGIFEFFAYFLAAISGGIISAILHGHYINIRSNLKKILIDLTIILFASIACIFIGALIETYLIIG